MSCSLINLHAFLPRSRTNGPGWRSVIWFQGCTLNCPDCFNPDTHPNTPREWVTPKDLVERCLAAGAIEGVTISGGEPMQQVHALLSFLRHFRARSGGSVLLFSGYARGEIEALSAGREVLACVDILVAGRYDGAQPCADGLRASQNQEVCFLSQRYSTADVEPSMAEVIIQPDGQIVVTGFPPEINL